MRASAHSPVAGKSGEARQREGLNLVRAPSCWPYWWRPIYGTVVWDRDDDSSRARHGSKVDYGIRSFITCDEARHATDTEEGSSWEAAKRGFEEGRLDRDVDLIWQGLVSTVNTLTRQEFGRQTVCAGERGGDTPLISFGKRERCGSEC